MRAHYTAPGQQNNMPQPTEIFFSYAHEDEELMNDVRRQLIVYDKQNEIVKWYDRLISPGGDWAGEIDERMRQARIILLFVSPHFIESRYCYDVEMAEALRRHKLGQTIVIPIILRPCPWHDSPIGQLQALPRDGKAITLWPNRDEVSLSVAEGVMSVVRRINSTDPSETRTRQEVEKLHEEVGNLLNQSQSGQEGGGESLVNKDGVPSVKWLILRLLAVTIVIVGASALLTELDILLAKQLWIVQPILVIYFGCELFLFGYFWKKRGGRHVGEKKH